MALTLKVTADRVSEMPFRIYRQVAQDPDSMARFLGHFAYDEQGNVYLSMDAALAQLDELTMGEISQLVETIRDQTDSVAAPKV